MKLKDVHEGSRYHAKVSGALQVVRVTKLKQVPGFRSERWKTIICAVNERTGRRITIRSPLRLRPLPGNGCEFCDHPHNRKGADWTCPYCGRCFSQT